MEDFTILTAQYRNVIAC